MSSFYGIAIRMFFNEDFHPGRGAEPRAAGAGRPSPLMAYHRSMLALPPDLVEAVPREGYVVHLRFEDGLAADVDLSYLLEFGGVFEPLRDLGFFRKLAIDDGGNTIAWPNEADSAPETLYDHVQRAVYEKRRALSAN